MAFADVAPLIVDLQLKDGLSGGLARAKGEVAGFGTAVGTTAVGGVSRLESALGGVGGALGHAGNQLKGLVTGPAGILAATGGMIGLAAGIKDAVTSATDFQSAMELIATQAGGTQAEVDAMTKGILAMSASVATAPDVLAAGLYHLESAGIRGQKALDALRIAAEGAKVGNADLESVTNALVGAINSGVKGTSDLAGTMGTLNAIVGAGNMRMQDLTDAFSTGILATAKTFGISIQSVGAAIADMTNQGVPAIDAATRLRMSMSLLAAPTSAAAKEFKAIGLGQLDLANAMRGPGGIASAVQMLADHMKKAGLIDANGQPTSAGADLLSKAFGGGRSSSAIMTLIGSLGKLNDIQTQINTGAGNFDAAWQKTTEDAAFNFEKFQAAVGVIAIKLGNVLLPPLTAAAGAAADWLGDPSNQQSLVGGLNSVIGLAQQVGGAFKDYVIPAIQAIGGAWNSIPSQLRELLVGGFVANKAAGWLFGTSPLSALMGLLRGAGSKVPVVGGLIGAAGATPVYVTNWPAGGFGGPGANPLPTIAEVVSGFLAPGLLTTILTAAAPIIMFDIIPNLFPGTPKPGATVGGETQVTLPGDKGTLPNTAANPVHAQMTGLMPSYNVFLYGTGAKDVAPYVEPPRSVTDPRGRDNPQLDALLAGQEKTAKATRDTYAVEEANGAKQQAADAATQRRLDLIAANTGKGATASDHTRSLTATQAAAAAASARTSQQTATAAQQFRDRLIRLNADENSNSAATRRQLAQQKPPSVAVTVTNNVTVTDINQGQHVTIHHGGGTTYYGNRPVGVGPGVN